MKKIFALFVLCLFLSGCHDVTSSIEPIPSKPSPDAVTETPSSTDLPTPPVSPIPSISPSPLVSPEPSANTLTLAAINAIIDIDWPETFTIPTPLERTIFPLTQPGWWYQTFVSGKVTFVDAELNQVSLPFEPSAFANVGTSYALQHPDESYGWVLMLGDGTLPTDKNGRYYEPIDVGEDGYYFDTIGNAIVTIRTVETPEGEIDQKFGLYNMNEKCEILPREYAQIDTSYSNRLFYAEKDGQWTLHDLTGRVLHELDGFPKEHIFNEGDRLFYKIPAFYYYNLYLSRWDELYIINASFDRDYFLATCDQEGRELYRSEYGSHQKKDGELLIRSRYGDDWISLDKNMTVQSVPPPERPPERLKSIWRESDHYVINPPNGEQFNVVINTDSILETRLLLLNHFDHFLFLFEYTDPEDPMRIEPRAVYALDGTLLLDNVYGWIEEVPAPGGGLFVYPDPETCVLLMPDGSTTPVSAAPAVEKEYWS